jgi:hypothetical protein
VICKWCITGKPPEVREDFKSPNCEGRCKDKPAGLRSPADIVTELKHRMFMGAMKARAHRPAKVYVPDRRRAYGC